MRNYFQFFFSYFFSFFSLPETCSFRIIFRIQKIFQKQNLCDNVESYRQSEISPLESNLSNKKKEEKNKITQKKNISNVVYMCALDSDWEKQTKKNKFHEIELMIALIINHLPSFFKISRCKHLHFLLSNFFFLFFSRTTLWFVY